MMESIRLEGHFYRPISTNFLRWRRENGHIDDPTYDKPNELDYLNVRRSLRQNKINENDTNQLNKNIEHREKIQLNLRQQLSRLVLFKKKMKANRRMTTSKRRRSQPTLLTNINYFATRQR